MPEVSPKTTLVLPFDARPKRTVAALGSIASARQIEIAKQLLWGQALDTGDFERSTRDMSRDKAGPMIWGSELRAEG